MTNLDFGKVRELFHRGCDLPVAERAAFLEAECGSDSAVRAAVEELFFADQTGGVAPVLSSDAIARQLLASAPDHTPEEPIDEIGPYRIIRILGEGGMGVAYLARQTNPDREVALKVLRSSAPSVTLRRRFEQEVRVLGRLNHPGIARIFEAGTAQNPRGVLAYFAMEFVDGPRLNNFVAAGGLGVSDKIELVARIADAVQHAHTRGVIHRDLKPANILVRDAVPDEKTAGDRTRDGSRVHTLGPQPVILDFGVARVLEGDEPRSALTEAGLLIGTIATMSPEQLDGDNDGVDARADVYALGVILYEVLTGRSPFDVRGKPVAEAARIIRDEEPAPLNSRLNSSRAIFGRDIETIVAKAMSKDRGRRYTTAAAFSEDLRRVLRDEPIQARPATLAYHASKFARRHRGVVAGVAVAALTLVVGLGVSLTLYVRAEAQRERADTKERLGAALQDYLIGDLLKAAAPDRMGNDATLVTVLLESRHGLHERFAAQPEVEAKVHAALGGVLRTLGLYKESCEEWTAASALLDQTSGPDSEAAITAKIAESEAFAAARKPVFALNTGTEAVERARRAFPAHHALLISALQRVGKGYELKSHFGTANKYYREARQLAEFSPVENAGVISELIGSMMICERRRLGGGNVAPLEDELAERLKALGPTDPLLFEMSDQLLKSYVTNGRLAEAIALADQLPAMIEQDTRWPIRRGLRFRHLSQTYLAVGRHEEAEKYALLSNAAYASMPGTDAKALETCARLMVDLYSGWPTREAQLRDWSVREIACRMARPAGRPTKTIAGRLQKCVGLLQKAGLATTTHDLLDDLWNRRDELVPANSASRPQFFQAFVQLSELLEYEAHRREAAELAGPKASATREDTVDPPAVGGD